MDIFFLTSFLFSFWNSRVKGENIRGYFFKTKFQFLIWNGTDIYHFSEILLKSTHVKCLLQLRFCNPSFINGISEQFGEFVITEPKPFFQKIKYKLKED